MHKITVPTPKRLPSGEYNIWLAKEKKSVTAKTPKLCQEQALAIRIGLAQKNKSEFPNGLLTLEEFLNDYIYSRENVISPATLRGYNDIVRNRFKAYHSTPVKDINWQRMISDEAKLVSPKTVKNAWGLVASAIKDNEMPLPKVKLPQAIVKDEPWLDFEQIKTLLQNCQGYTCEMGVLLALHGLRRSELIAITPKNIVNDTIQIRGAIVRGEGGYEYKPTNKNSSSTRNVPIMIPRLKELIATSDCKPDEPYVKMNPNHLYTRINEACDRANLPHVGVHGLRRSFASLCYHLGLSELQTMKLGGWSDFGTMRKIYTKLASADMDSGIEKIKDFFNS